VVFVEMGGSMLFYSISSSQSLKRRKLELSTDIDSLTASAYQLSEWSESSRSRDMSILVKSNAMRKALRKRLLKWQSWTSSWQTSFLSWKTVN